MMRAYLIAALVAACCLAPAHAQERRLDPLDEAAKDASWVSFRQGLRAALAKRDREYVVGILDANVRSGLEGGRGVEEFRTQWQLDSETSPLWPELAAILALPSAWHRPDEGPAELCVPYVSVRWPQDMDAYRGGAIVAGKVSVKSEPYGAARTVASLSYNIVEVADWEVDDRSPASKQKWVRIRLKGSEGYVREEQIRSPIEHAACFVKSEGGWRLVGFGPGGGK
jgi:hypothetical protein